MADELADPKYGLVLDIEYLVIGEDIRVLIEIESLFDLIDLSLDAAELLIVYFRHMHLADDGPLILQGRQNRIVKERII